MSGHVLHFDDYQHDVAAMVDAARELDLPKPWFVLGHSMGGGIALKSVMDGLPVAGASFSAPMWGIQISAALRPIAGRWDGAAAARGSITSTPPEPRPKATCWSNRSKRTA